MTEIRSLAVVVPVYNEAESLEDLFAALHQLKVQLKDVELRALFVDDHSDDETLNLLQLACKETEWFSFARLSARSGSHVAIIAGLSYCDDDCAVFIAADLQDPPPMIPQMMSLCAQGWDVVWATWIETEERSFVEDATSRLFHWLMQRVSSVAHLPHRASFALLSRRAYRNLVQGCNRRPSLIVEIPRLGFSVATVPFDKPRRNKGRSKWNLGRKIVAFGDALVSSSYVPLRLMIYLGVLVSFVGFVYATFLVGRALFGRPTVIVEGWTSLMVVVLVLSGLQMLMTGIIGEYLWRTKEGTRRDALFLIEDQANMRSGSGERA